MLIGSHPAYTGEAGGNTWHALQLLIRLDNLPIHIVPLPLSDLEWSTVLITIICQHLYLLAPSSCFIRLGLELLSTAVGQDPSAQVPLYLAALGPEW